MKSPSKITRHEYYNLYQRLVMGRMLSSDELNDIPELLGAYVIWLDEAPPQCLKVGVVSRDIENGLREELEAIINSKINGAILASNLKNDKKLSRKYKLNFNKVEDRQKFLREHVYIQVLPIPDLPKEEYKNLYYFLENDSGLKPRYTRSNRKE